MFSPGERDYLMLLQNCKHFVNEYNRLVKMKLAPNITTLTAPNITTDTNDLQFEDVNETSLPEVVEGADYSWLDNYDDDAPMEIFSNQEHQRQEEQERENRRLLRLAIEAAKGDAAIDERSTPPQRSDSGVAVKRTCPDEEEATPARKRRVVARKLEF